MNQKGPAAMMAFRRSMAIVDIARPRSLGVENPYGSTFRNPHRSRSPRQPNRAPRPPPRMDQYRGPPRRHLYRNRRRRLLSPSDRHAQMAPDDAAGMVGRHAERNRARRRPDDLFHHGRLLGPVSRPAHPRSRPGRGAGMAGRDASDLRGSLQGYRSQP